MALSRVKAMKAQCSQCMGFYGDGREDCENPLCSLYQWMPHRDKKNKPIFWWEKSKVFDFGAAYNKARDEKIAKSGKKFG